MSGRHAAPVEPMAPLHPMYDYATVEPGGPTWDEVLMEDYTYDPSNARPLGEVWREIVQDDLETLRLIGEGMRKLGEVTHITAMVRGLGSLVIRQPQTAGRHRRM